MIDQTHERLIKIQQAHIAQRLGEKARIQQVHAGMLCAADVYVYRQHLVHNLFIKRLLCIIAVRVPEIVPGRANKGIHGICIPFCGRPTHRAGRIHKALMFEQRRSAIRRKVHIIRQQHRQILFRHRHSAAVRAVDHGDGRAPIPLAGN